MLDLIEDHGSVGVLNAPTVGLLEGAVRAELERRGLGMRCELELLTEARDRGLEAWAYVFDPEWVRAAIDSGATGLVLHLGVTSVAATLHGHRSEILDSVAAARAQSSRLPVLLHGGPITTTSDLVDLVGLLRRQGLQGRIGFLAASVIESAPDRRAAIRDWQRAVGEVNA